MAADCASSTPRSAGIGHADLRREHQPAGALCVDGAGRANAHFELSAGMADPAAGRSGGTTISKRRSGCAAGAHAFEAKCSSSSPPACSTARRRGHLVDAVRPEAAASRRHAARRRPGRSIRAAGKSAQSQRDERASCSPRSTWPNASNRSSFTTWSATTTGSTSSTSASIAAGSVLPPSPTMQSRPWRPASLRCAKRQHGHTRRHVSDFETGSPGFVPNRSPPAEMAVM